MRQAHATRQDFDVFQIGLGGEFSGLGLYCFSFVLVTVTLHLQQDSYQFTVLFPSFSVGEDNNEFDTVIKVDHCWEKQGDLSCTFSVVYVDEQSTLLFFVRNGLAQISPCLDVARCSQVVSGARYKCWSVTEWDFDCLSSTEMTSRTSSFSRHSCWNTLQTTGRVRRNRQSPSLPTSPFESLLKFERSQSGCGGSREC